MKARRLKPLASSMLALGFVSGFVAGRYSTQTEFNHRYTGASFYENTQKNELQRFGILISDMEDQYWERVDLEEQAAEIHNYTRIIDFAAENNIPVAVMTDPEGNPMNALAAVLGKVPRVYQIRTNKNSAFNGTDLAEWFRNQKVNTVYIVGLYSSVCVLDTANDALKHGFDIATAGNTMSDGIKMKEFDDRKYGKNSPYHEERLWYKANGIYSDDFKDIIALMK
jgi:isochorismate hydrolase